MNSRDLYLWINMIQGLNLKTYKKLLSKFHSLENLWNAPKEEIMSIEKINTKLLNKIITSRNINLINKYKEKLSSLNIHYIIKGDVTYPNSLNYIFDPPELLYIKGNIDYEYDKSIAIVGSRKATSYGKKIAYDFANKLANHGIAVISGLAYGIDSAAHEGALAAGGKTIAVLGCGLDICYPKSNANLKRKIEKTGAVISEFPLGMLPYPSNFPQRNRIISGLSKYVLVVEAGLKSGSLITVEHALEQGKEVLVVPGNILSSNSQGTNKLLKEGAKPITCIEDILEEFNIDSKSNSNIFSDLSNTENKVLDLIIRKQPIYIDTIATMIDIDTSELNSIITVLELKGIIEQLPGKIIIAKK